MEQDAGPGKLTISDRTVERIAATALGEVDGVGGSVTRMLGVAVGRDGADQAAKVTASVSGGIASLVVRLSVTYPASVANTTEAARAHVVQRVEELTGIKVARVDITVTELSSVTSNTRRVQ
ncbi:Asp23/Gls24 family envelope stress response protein [Umezawaea endophytica]|uniref:Asp23/Gls24 family envelope stress response protein n=1 Tax=Umezawaea endophytica TaxID=1654476 RepID=A0A9X2VLA3_9PSEU|nr:Asp23/Gls24 family envelope stress response protein [Umezawaea endophytica]MCS7478519.1 Asp23/Gls24 family envelope stress response protein [Umezawaea endophytica]